MHLWVIISPLADKVLAFKFLHLSNSQGRGLAYWPTNRENSSFFFFLADYEIVSFACIQSTRKAKCRDARNRNTSSEPALDAGVTGSVYWVSELGLCW